MKVRLEYGRDGLDVQIPSLNVSVIAPKFLEGLQDEETAFRASVRNPINTRPLRETIRPEERVAVVIPDITRPLVTDRLLRWTFEELTQVPEKNFTIVVGTGSPRPNTGGELGGGGGRGGGVK